MNGVYNAQSAAVGFDCGPHRVQPTPPGTVPTDIGHDIVRAAAVEIIRLAETIAKDPANPRAFLLIEKFAVSARDMLSMQGEYSDRQPLGGPAIPVFGGSMTNYSNYVGSGGPFVNPLAPAPASETFGTTALREIVAAMSKKKPADIVRAIVAAEKLGRNDIADDLRKQLGVPKVSVQAEESSATFGPVMATDLPVSGSVASGKPGSMQIRPVRRKMRKSAPAVR